MSLYTTVADSFNALNRTFRKGFLRGFSMPGEFDAYIVVMEACGHKFPDFSEVNNSSPLYEQCEQLAENLGNRLSKMQESSKIIILNLFYLS